MRATESTLKRAAALFMGGLFFWGAGLLAQVPVNNRVELSLTGAQAEYDPQGWILSTATLEIRNTGDRILQEPLFLDILLSGSGDLSQVTVSGGELVSGRGQSPRWRVFPTGTGGVDFLPGENLPVELVFLSPPQVQLGYQTDVWARVANEPVRTVGQESGFTVSMLSAQSDFDPSTGMIVSTAQLQLKNGALRSIRTPLYLDVLLSGNGQLTQAWVEDAVRISASDQPPRWRRPMPAQADMAKGQELSQRVVLHRPAELQIQYGIEVQEPASFTPVAAFSLPPSVRVGQSLELNGSASVDPEGGVLQYRWIVPDGELQGKVVSFAATQSGAYEIALEVTNEGGESNMLVRQLLVVPETPFALGRMRTLDQSGQPLAAVTVEEVSTGGAGSVTVDQEGFAVLGGEPGDYIWKFSTQGFLPAWRKGTLTEGAVTWIASPWMAARQTSGRDISPLSPAVFDVAGGPFSFSFPAGSFSDTGILYVTALGPQSLPFPIPMGWTPRHAFALETAVEMLSPGSVYFPEAAGDQAGAWIRLDPESLHWKVLTAPAFEDDEFLVATAGTYAFVLPDSGATAPPVPEEGQELPGTTVAVPVAGSMEASGVVHPEVALASMRAAEVTARAEVEFTSTQPIPSGSVFRTQIREVYDLVSGERRRTPTYDTTVTAYAAEGVSQRVATFPLRPRLLMGGDALVEALIEVDVFPMTGYQAAVVDADGGRFQYGSLALVVPPMEGRGTGIVELRDIDLKAVRAAFGGTNPVFAFELLGPPLSSEEYGVSIAGRGAGADYLLARIIDDGAVSGLEPILRMRTGADGEATSVEPSVGPRLPGVQQSGRYVLLLLDAPVALVHGTVTTVAGESLPGLPVRLASTNFVAPTRTGGTYKLVAPVGEGAATAFDPSDDNEARGNFVINEALQDITVDLAIVVTRPSVVSVTPSDGAENVSLVTSVTVSFSRAMNPGSLGISGVVLRDGAGAVVPATLSLDRNGREARLLTLNPLQVDTAYSIELASDLEDLRGYTIEGQLIYAFRTRPASARDEGGQLVIYEPDAETVPAAVLARLVGYNPQANLSMVVATGTAGTAEAEVPVILVNETTGETATVLSQPDGSFASFIRAGEEDYITAVFINRNGSAVTVPATEQRFDNGNLGLYRYGGILEAESDGGPVKVFVEPEAIRDRTVLSLNPISLAEVLQLLGGIEPEGDSQVLGGFEIGMEGDELTIPADVSFPVDPSTIEVPDGMGPEDLGYVLYSPYEVEGLKVYRILDKMHYQDGALHTASPPFSGIVYPGVHLLGRYGSQDPNSGAWAVLSGKAVSTNGSKQAETGDHRPLPGAVISAHAEGVELSINNRLTPGQYVSVADSNGTFALMVNVNNYVPVGFVLTGTSSLVPGVIGFGHATVGILDNVGTGKVYFDRTAATSVVGEDQTVPEIRVRKSQSNPGLNMPFLLTVTGIDDSGVLSVEATILGVDPLPGTTGITPAVNDVTMDMTGSMYFTGTTVGSRDFPIQAIKPLRLRLEITATDTKLNEARLETFVDFGLPTPDPIDFVEDPLDYEGPFILETFPVEGDDSYDRFRPVIIHFSEPISEQVLGGTTGFYAVTVSPSAGEPVVELSEDRTTLNLWYPDMRSSTAYRLTIRPDQIRDISGNALNQFLGMREIPPDVYINFETLPDFNNSIPQIRYGGGVVNIGDTFYALERSEGGTMGSGMLYLFNLDSDRNPVNLIGTGLPPMPRAIVAIPEWSYLYKGTTRLNRKLIAIAGGLPLSGVADSDGTITSAYTAWIRLYDVTNPSAPEMVTHSWAFGDTSSLITKLAWAPPVLGLLEVGDRSQVHYVDLQLMITAHDKSLDWSTLPINGVQGLDADGDGAYTTAPGDVPPQPRGIGLQSGLINGGLVATYPVPDQPHARILDFSIAFGGRYLGIATDTGFYQTVLWNGLPVVGVESPVGDQARRLTTLFGVELVDYLGQTRIANLALVSAGNALKVLDISHVFSPATGIDCIEFDPPERPQSVYLTETGLVAVATDKDVYLFEPAQFGNGSGVCTLAGTHPGHRYRLSGAGTRSYSFFSDGAGIAVNCFAGTNAIVAPFELQIPFTVQELNPIRDSDGDPPPPKGPFFIAGKKALRYPIDGVLSLVVSDDTPGSKFSGGAIFDTLSNVYKVAIASPVNPKPREVTFEAVIDPPDKTPPDGFPEWTMAGLTYKGKKVTIPFEAYKGTRPPSGNFWRASAFTPDSYDLTCDPSGSPQSVRIQVYPSEARVLEVGIMDFVSKFDELLNVFSNLSGSALFPSNDGFQIKAYQAASDDVARIHKGILAMDAARQGLVPFDEDALDGKPLKKSRKSAGPADLKFSFANAWEECNNPRTGRSNEVNLTYRAKAAFDPLISAEGKISIKYPVPSFPFIIVDVGFGLAGKLGLSLDIFRDGCAQEISTCGKLTGNLTATVSVEVSVIYMVGVEAATQTGLTTDATICADFNTKKIEATFNAQFDGIKTTVSLTFIGGVLKRTSDPIVLCDPYPFTPSVFTLYTFQ